MVNVAQLQLEADNYVKRVGVQQAVRTVVQKGLVPSELLYFTRLGTPLQVVKKSIVDDVNDLVVQKTFA